MPTKNEKILDHERLKEHDMSMERPLPVLYKEKKECCGCAACFSVCPMSGSAITMRFDSEGFLYPVVDTSVCIRCYKCIAVCPAQHCI